MGCTLTVMSVLRGGRVLLRLLLHSCVIIQPGLVNPNSQRSLQTVSTTLYGTLAVFVVALILAVVQAVAPAVRILVLLHPTIMVRLIQSHQTVALRRTQHRPPYRL